MLSQIPPNSLTCTYPSQEERKKFSFLITHISLVYVFNTKQATKGL